MPFNALEYGEARLRSVIPGFRGKPCWNLLATGGVDGCGFLFVRPLTPSMEYGTA